MSRKFVFLFFLVIVLFPAFSQAQGLGNSPYSQIGIGDLITPVSVQNLGTGGISVAGYNREYIQLSNPAASVNKKGLYNDSLVKIEGAGSAQYKVLSNSQTRENSSGANFRYFAFTLPIGKVWNTTLSMQPFSAKDQTFSQMAPVTNDPNQTTKQFNYQGKGGIYQIALNNGWGIGKSLSLGLGMAYLFGPATTTETAVLVNNPYAPVQSDVQHGFRQRINHRGLAFKPAMHYRKEFYKWKDTVLVPANIFWNVGATLQIFTPMMLQINTYNVRQSSSGTVSEDSLVSGTTQTANLPAQFTMGFSIDKPNRWMVGVEGGIANWTNFSYPGDIASYQYRVAWNLGMGAEFRPVTRRQWKARTYRVGVNFSRLPYAVDGFQLNDLSGSLGLTIPVGVRGASGASFPKINLAIIVGQRGALTSQSSAIQEIYARLHLSILITDKWFIKRRIQ
ncbi:MAG: hypothetical protein JWO58_1367 [Chitinophagaceae bacterium]|nr:hypothetical protein [Chitinophagaceae bacterium]